MTFGSVATSSTAIQWVAIYNTGDERLDISGASISGTDADEFSLVAQQDLCPGQLAAGGSCTMQVAFAPSRVTAATATLQLSSANANPHPTVNVALSGTGATPAPLPNGPQGPAGSTGATGSTGAAGAEGDTGATGATGANGATGHRGPGGKLTPIKAAPLSGVSLRSRR